MSRNPVDDKWLTFSMVAPLHIVGTERSTRRDRIIDGPANV